MNKGKVFTISIISIICVSILGVILLSAYVLSNTKFDINLNNIVSYAQTSNQTDVLGQSTDSNIPTDAPTYLVTAIVDGDTIKVMENGEKKTIRLIGIDAPEVKSKDCKYQEATDLLTNLILNKKVVLQSDSSQTDIDKYGRQLRYVFINGVNVNQQVIKEGLATEYKYSKTYMYRDDFLNAQSNAKAEHLGVWSSECGVK